MSRLAIALYAAVAMVTFGHSTAQPKQCWALDHGKWVECSSFEVGVDGLTSAALWPLYWSWVAWEADKPAATGDRRRHGQGTDTNPPPERNRTHDL